MIIYHISNKTDYYHYFCGDVAGVVPINRDIWIVLSRVSILSRKAWKSRWAWMLPGN